MTPEQRKQLDEKIAKNLERETRIAHRWYGQIDDKHAEFYPSEGTVETDDSWLEEAVTNNCL